MTLRLPNPMLAMRNRYDFHDSTSSRGQKSNQSLLHYRSSQQNDRNIPSPEVIPKTENEPFRFRDWSNYNECRSAHEDQEKFKNEKPESRYTEVIAEPIPASSTGISIKDLYA